MLRIVFTWRSSSSTLASGTTKARAGCRPEVHRGCLYVCNPSSQTLKQRLYTKEGPFRDSGLPTATRYSRNALEMTTRYSRNALEMTRRRKPENNLYIQKKVRLGIQDFPLQRVIAATLPA